MVGKIDAQTINNNERNKKKNGMTRKNSSVLLTKKNPIERDSLDIVKNSHHQLLKKISNGLNEQRELDADELDQVYKSYRDLVGNLMERYNKTPLPYLSTGKFLVADRAPPPTRINKRGVHIKDSPEQQKKSFEQNINHDNIHVKSINQTDRQTVPEITGKTLPRLNNKMSLMSCPSPHVFDKRREVLRSRVLRRSSELLPSKSPQVPYLVIDLPRQDNDENKETLPENGRTSQVSMFDVDRYMKASASKSKTRISVLDTERFPNSQSNGYLHPGQLQIGKDDEVYLRQVSSRNRSISF